MTRKPRKCEVFHRIELVSLGINQMSIDNQLNDMWKRDKNPSQPINSPFIAPKLCVPKTNIAPKPNALY